MIIYLVRHGQTDWNNERRMQGHKNIPMNKVGIQQINDLADKIVEAGLRFDRLISSPLDRARKSAEIIANKTGFKYTKQLTIGGIIVFVIIIGVVIIVSIGGAK